MELRKLSGKHAHFTNAQVLVRSIKRENAYHIVFLAKAAHVAMRRSQWDYYLLKLDKGTCLQWRRLRRYMTERITLQMVIQEIKPEHKPPVGVSVVWRGTVEGTAAEACRCIRQLSGRIYE